MTVSGLYCNDSIYCTFYINGEFRVETLSKGILKRYITDDTPYSTINDIQYQ